MEVRVSSRVWVEYLDPFTSDIQKELALGEPRSIRRGRGGQNVYEGVSKQQALDLALYLSDRAGVLLGNGDAEDNAVHRTALRNADAIRKQLGLKRLPSVFQDRAFPEDPALFE